MIPDSGRRIHTIAIRLTAGERRQIHARGRAKGFRSSSEFARHVAASSTCPRRSPDQLARERCVHLLALLVNTINDAMKDKAADPTDETRIGLEALSQIYVAMLASGGPPEPPEADDEMPFEVSSGEADRRVFLQVRLNAAEFAELVRRAGEADVTAYLRPRLLGPLNSRCSPVRPQANELWLRALTGDLTALRRGRTLGGRGLDDAVETLLTDLRYMLIHGYVPGL